MEVVNAVKHYQRNIERCSGDRERILHILEKLYRLPVTVQHLKETGVGRTVNALRKYRDDTGEAAKALVNKWKAMVVECEFSDEEVSDKPQERTESPPARSSTHKHKSSHSDSHRDRSHSETNKSMSKNHPSSSYSDKRKDKSSSRAKHTEQGHKRRHGEETHREEEKRRRKVVEEESDVEEVCEDEHRDDDDDDDEEEEEVHGNNHENVESDQEKEEDDEENDASDVEEISGDIVKQENSDSSDAEHMVDVKVKHKPPSYSPLHCENLLTSEQSKSSSHRRHESQNSKSHREDLQKSDRSHDKFNHRGDNRHGKKSEIKSENRSTSENKNNSVHPSSKDNKLKSKEKEKSEKKDKSKEKVKSRERTEIKKEDRSKESNCQKRDDKTKSQVLKQDRKSSSSLSSSKSESKNKSSSKKIKVPVEGVDGIDSFSGTSFADALGMMGMIDTVSKKKKKVSFVGSSSSKRTEEPSASKASTSGTSSHSPIETTHYTTTYSRTDASPDDVNLLDPSTKLAPLDQLEMEVDVDATLPAINPNYRPLPHFNFDMPSRSRAKILSEEEALCQVMSTKNQRTKVYSGVKNAKNWATVPSLFDMCVRVLQENIDALEYTGGVPYDLLKPVLLLASPQQLFTLEHYNPYLIEDTDELWEAHVRRKFRNQRRLDMESHREMYQRCLAESEAKLKALTINIQNSMAKSLPVRQTKLAYVDSMAKPPRQVARKQAKFGTANATASTPMAKVQKLASPPTTSSNSNNSPVVHVPAPRSSHSAKVKPRMAPLMQKTMKLAKSFKR